MATDGSRSVGLVHDYLLVMRGAERTFLEIASLWPGAPIHTLLYDAGGINGGFRERTIHTSRLQIFGPSQNSFRRLFPLFARATEQLATDRYELVVSSSSAFAHGARVREGALHVCYCHTPFRYAWHEHARTLRNTAAYARPGMRAMLDRMRAWDLAASKRVTHYIANSHLTRERIGDFWNRDAAVVHPPVDVDRFHLADPEDYFLVVAELVSHKRVEIALEAAQRAGKPIKVVGSGPELKRLRTLYGATTDFLGRVPERDLVELYARCRALVVPNIEEFGIAAVEAQAAGRPVLAATLGGALETVIADETGVLVRAESVNELAEAMMYTDFDRFEPDGIRRHAERFSAVNFSERFTAEVARLTGSGTTAELSSTATP
jgi:glycosyltransferase involved in cell wall biosynthesis